MNNIDSKQFFDVLKIDLYRIVKSKFVITLFIFEIVSIIIALLNNSETFFLNGDIIKTEYFNLSITLRYLMISIIVSKICSNDIEKGLFRTYIASGIKREIVLINKIFVVVIMAFFSQIVGNLLYIIINVIANGVNIELLYIFGYNAVNFITLFVFILIIVCIDLISMASYITFLFTFSIVFFSTMLPLDIAKYIITSYNNTLLVWNYASTNDIITMIVVIIVYFVVFFSIDFYCIKKMDL